MKTLFVRALLFLGLAFYLGGCAAYDTQAEKGHSLVGIKRFFVISNQNDNNALDRQIVAALKARGLEADAGPLTMMPDDTQVILAYQDRWNWDFSDHLVYFALSARDIKSEQPFKSTSFSAKIPLREETPVTIARIVDRLLAK